MKSDYVEQKSQIFLGVIPPVLIINLARRLKPITDFFVHMYPSLKKDLKDSDYEYTANEYVGLGLISYCFLGLIFGFLLGYVILAKLQDFPRAFLVGFGVWFVTTILFTYLLVKIPGKNLQVAAIDVDRSLMYALKDMILQADSGSSLFEAITSVSESDYGYLTKELRWTVRQVNVGVPLNSALESLVSRSRSEYLRKAVWQLINSVKTGSNLKSTLNPIVEELNDFQKLQIQRYSRELNLWALLYMMAAVAIPTIGSTMLVVLSAFANFGITREFFIGFVTVFVFVQVGLIKFVQSRRPNVQF